MPRYFFHIENGTGTTRDETGAELPDIAAARDQAVMGIRSILRDEVAAGVVDFTGMIRIADHHGHILLEVPFDTAVKVRNPNRIG